MVQASWNDLQFSFFTFLATLIFWCVKLGVYKNTCNLKNEAPSLKLFLCKSSSH